ncbi:hypothetical protein GF377_04370 [candidate division GN15 bacterium]|nr:hypothetical protein [candidate division GN15 bacterium]
MFRDVLQSIDGVAAYPVIALILFVAAFVGVLIWVWRLDRTKVDRWSRMPLDGTIRSHDDRVIDDDRSGKLVPEGERRDG